MDTDRRTPAPTASRPGVWDIRTAAAEDVTRFLGPLSAAFSEEITPPELESWQKTIEPDRLISAFEGPEGRDPLGTAGAYTFRMTVPGGEAATAGVTAVGVRPDHHRRGILRALMRNQLDDIRARGEPLAVLWASEGAIYQRFGYGLATLSGSLEVDPARTTYARPAPPEGRMRLLAEKEALAAFAPVYDAMLRVTPGALSRTEAWWRSGPLADPEYARRGAGPKLRYLYEADGRAEGYVMYRVRSEWDHRGSKSQLEVYEAVTLTPRALRDVWRFLFEVDLVRSVRAGRVPVPNPLQHLLAEPRALGLVVGDGTWVRVVDLPAALAARRYGAADELVLEVTDAFCPWNAGRWRLATSGGAGTAEAIVTPTGTAPDLVLDASDLAAVYLGAHRPSDLAVAGRVEDRTHGALRRADVLFAADRTPWCVTMF